MTRYGHSPHSTMKHLNGNLLCAIDVETTGLIPGKHDIIQIAILPLDTEVKPLQTVLPFCMNMKPKRPENVDREATKTHRIDMTKLIIDGFDPWKAVDLFEEWFERLKLPVGKKISPLAHNWPFDRSFIIDWIGDLSFEHYFDSRYRDSMVAALYLNDRADHHCERYPFPKVSLSYCCTQLKIEHPHAHEALSDCVTTAEIYRRLMHEPTL